MQGRSKNPEEMEEIIPSCAQERPSGCPDSSKFLEVDVLQVHGAAVSAIQKPQAQEAGQTGTGVMLAFPEEGDLGREESSTFTTGSRTFEGASGHPTSPLQMRKARHRVNQSVKELEFGPRQLCTYTPLLSALLLCAELCTGCPGAAMKGQTHTSLGPAGNCLDINPRSV